MEDQNNGDCGSSSWSGYGQETIASNVSSSRSGTIASTAYTSSNTSGLSTLSMDAALHFLSLGIHGDVDDWEQEQAEEERIRSMVLEFFSTPSANCVERWLAELGVSWVLSLHDGAGASAGKEELDRHVRTWIRAIHQIVQAICFMMPLFPDHANMPNICVEQGKPVGVRMIPDGYHLALFIQITMLKIFAFVDFLVTWCPETRTEECLSTDSVRLPPYGKVFRLMVVHDAVMLPPYSKLFNLLVVHDALSEASNKILWLFGLPTSVEVKRIEDQMVDLLSAYKNRLCEAIRSTMEMVRTKSMEDGDESSSPLGSSDIHKVTRSVTTYIRFLWANYSSVDVAIRGKCTASGQHDLVPHIENVRPLDIMIMEIVSCLQEKLVDISKSFPDQGLRCLFLLNNSYNIQQLYNLLLYSREQQRSKIGIILTDKILEDLMDRYLQVSWAPLLSSLGKNSSLLSKFESRFQKIYTAQLEWKVPDHELRRRLRQAITDKVIPCYRNYIEDNKVTHPKISPHDLKAMLQELFEG